MSVTLRQCVSVLCAEEVPLQACLEADFVIPQEHSVSPVRAVLCTHCAHLCAQGGAKRAQALKLQGNESFKAGAAATSSTAAVCAGAARAAFGCATAEQQSLPRAARC